MKSMHRWWIWIAALVAVMCAVIFGICDYKSECKRIMQNIAAENAAAISHVDTMLDEMRKIFTAESEKMQAFLDERERTDKEITEYLQRRTRILSTIVNARCLKLYGSFNGRFCCGNYWCCPSGVDLTSRTWYIEAMKAKGEPVFTPPYLPLDNSHQIVAVTRQLDHQPNTVFSMDISLCGFEPTLSDSVDGSNDYRFYCAQDGTIIVSQEENSFSVGRFNEIAELVANASADLLEYKDDFVFYDISRYGWRVVCVKDRDNLLAHAKWMAMRPVLVSILAFAVFCLLLELLHHRFEFRGRKESVASLRGNRTQLAMFFVAATLFIGLVWFARDRIIDAEKRLAISEAEKIAERAVMSFNSFFAIARGAVDFCAQRIAGCERNGADNAALMAELNNLFCVYRSLSERNYRGLFLARPGLYLDTTGLDVPEGYDFKKYDFYRNALKNPNENILTSPYTSVMDNSRIVTITRAVNDDLGTVVGVDLPVIMIRLLLGDIQLNGVRKGMVLTKDGVIIDRRDFSKPNDPPLALADREIIDRALAEQGSFEIKDANGNRYHVVSVALSVGGRALMIGDERMLSSTLSAYRSKTFAVTVFVVVVAMIFAFFALRRIRHQRERAIISEESSRQAKQLAAALEEAHAANRRSKLLYEFVRGGSWSYDISEQGEVLASHYYIRTKSKMDVSEVSGPMTWLQLLHPDDRDRVEAAFMAAVRDPSCRTPYEVTYRLRDRCGVYQWVKTSGRVFVKKDGGRELLGLSIIITESIEKEQEVQKQLQAALAMANAANTAKTRFLFSMSHDIRTPMNAIRGFTGIAKKCVNDPQRLTDCLNKIDSSGELLLSLINSILDMSHIESGKAKLDESPGDIMQSFEAIETTMHELAKAKGIALTFEFGEVKNRYVYVDHDRCHRVFVNIISNAIKYSRPNGYVKVRCEQIEAGDAFGAQREAGENVAIFRYTFADNGIGMGEEFVEHVFEEFSRESNSTTSGIQGTGLGLALCKSFVELMGGEITCKSKRSEGTVFTVTLPLKVYAKPESANQDSPDKLCADGEEQDVSCWNKLQGKRVLLVEDNDMNREVADFVLKEQGLKVESAADGSIAVKLIEEKGVELYDYILMDIQMPIMDGYRATKLIRKLGFKRPIIALSANAFAEDKAASIAAGMNDHIAKPLKVKELMSVLVKFAT